MDNETLCAMWQATDNPRIRDYVMRGILKNNGGAIQIFVNRLSDPATHHEDFRQYAATWVMDALDTYDPDKGCCFFTHLSWKLRTALSRYIAQTGTVRTPYHAIMKGNKTQTTSLNNIMGSGVEHLARFGYAPTEKDEAAVYVDFLLTVLDDDEEDIVKKYLGVDCTKKTLREIAEPLGISRERVRQIRDVAYDKMRKYANIGRDMGDTVFSEMFEVYDSVFEKEGN